MKYSQTICSVSERALITKVTGRPVRLPLQTAISNRPARMRRVRGWRAPVGCRHDPVAQRVEAHRRDNSARRAATAEWRSADRGRRELLRQHGGLSTCATLSHAKWPGCAPSATKHGRRRRCRAFQSSGHNSAKAVDWQSSRSRATLTQ